MYKLEKYLTCPMTNKYAYNLERRTWFGYWKTCGIVTYKAEDFSYKSYYLTSIDDVVTAIRNRIETFSKRKHVSYWYAKDRNKVVWVYTFETLEELISLVPEEFI